MKIKSKQFSDFDKTDCCNNYAAELFQLDGWDENDWLCSICFFKELIENDYDVVPKENKRCEVCHKYKSSTRFEGAEELYLCDSCLQEKNG